MIQSQNGITFFNHGARIYYHYILEEWLFYCLYTKNWGLAIVQNFFIQYYFFEENFDQAYNNISILNLWKIIKLRKIPYKSFTIVVLNSRIANLTFAHKNWKIGHCAPGALLGAISRDNGHGKEFTNSSISLCKIKFYVWEYDPLNGYLGQTTAFWPSQAPLT